MSETTEKDRDLARIQRVLAHIVRYWREKPAEGLESLLVGEPETTILAAQPGIGIAAGRDVPKKPQPPWSIKARQIDLWSLLLLHLIAELEKSNLYAFWTSGGPEYDRLVARVLWELAPDGTEVGTKSTATREDAVLAQATAMAKVIGSFQDRAHRLQHRSSPMEAYPGSLISHSHDPLRLRRAGKAAWIAFIYPLLDTSRFKSGQVEALLDSAWEHIVQLGYVDIDLRFKDGDGWTDYNLRFGFGSLREAVVSGLQRATRRIGMIEVLGNDPETYLEGIFFSLKQGGIEVEPVARERVGDIVSGLAPVRPVGRIHPTLELGIAEHVPEELIALAAEMFPRPEDIAAFSEDIPLGDNTLFEAIDADLSALASGAEIPDPQQKQDFTQLVEVFCRSMRAMLVEDLIARDLPPGRSTELLRQLLKLNVSNWWREAVRRSAWLTIRYFGSIALKLRYAELDPGLAAVLQQYGITAVGWESYRADCGLAPRAATYSQERSTTTIEALTQYYWDRLIFISLKPDGTNHLALGRGVADFTAEGALLRFMALFNEFRAPTPPKPLGDPTVFGETDGTMREALASGDETGAFANLLIWQVLLQRLRELIDGSAGQDADDRSWFGTATVSGALGLCADFVFGQTTGLGQAPLTGYAEMRHPAIAPALALWNKAHNAEDVRAGLADWARREGDQGALNRLYMTRNELNRTIRHHLRDMMAPGYLPRMLKEIQAREADAYWRSPE